METEQQTQEELLSLINSMSEQQFNEWVMSWLDNGFIIDTVKNWDEETQRTEINNIKEGYKL